ncbi:MAG: PAS domain-containing protein, partial [Syntrophobacteraceae bacterium]
MEDTILYDKRRRKKLLIKIVLVYLIVGAFWIFFSDIIAAALAPSQEVLTRIQMIKGWLYILANALLLFYLLGRGLKELELSRETVRLYEMLAARSRDIILLVRSKDGKILEANSAASTAYGYDRETLLAMTIHDLRAPEAQGLVPEQLQIVETEGILFESVHKR